jgi:hypothetical protein
MQSSPTKTGGFLRFWIWLAAYLNFAGWFLSAIHQLNQVGYLAALTVFAVAVWHWRAEFNFFPSAFAGWCKWRRRFSRPLSGVFLVLATLVFFGGVFWAPTNYDALTYRLPRVLNWLMAGHWFWIPTINTRMNFSGAAWEWLAAPQLALLHSDRTLFLVNIVNFCLLPGLLFSVFRRLGVFRRTAWTWMWLLPFAYGYATQAGGLGNDLTGVVFCLASVHFGLCARQSGRVQDVWLAMLAAALMTGVKLSNLPLALPCVIAVLPALPLLKRRWLAGVAAVVLAMTASALPIMVMNQKFTGNYGGDPQNEHQVQVKNPAAAMFGNCLLLAQQSLMPPVLPGAQEIYQRLNEALPVSWHQFLHLEYPRYYLGSFQELPSEEGAGLGAGISLSLLAVLFIGLIRRPQMCWTSAATGIVLAALIAFSAYMAKMGSEATARLLLPYYPLLILPLLKLQIQECWLRCRVWQLWLLLVALSVFPAIILSPARPLWPAQTISRAWLQQSPNNPVARRVTTIYSTYANRNDLLRPLRELVLTNAQEIGLAADSNDSEYSLWRPFGTRVIRCLWRGRNPQIPVMPNGFEWLVVHVKEWDTYSSVPLPEWAARNHLHIVATIPITTFARRGADDWCLLHLEKATPTDVMNR